MSYLDTMLILYRNALYDTQTQERINALRHKFQDDQGVQLELDRRQCDLNEAITRNRIRMAEIARQN